MTVLQFRVAREFDVVTIKLSKEVKEHLAECERDELCTFCKQPLNDPTINPQHDNPTRGCHKTCAASIYYMIENKKRDKDGKIITNESMIEKGAWKIPEPPGRKSKNPAVLELLGKKATA